MPHLPRSHFTYFEYKQDRPGPCLITPSPHDFSQRAKLRPLRNEPEMYYALAYEFPPPLGVQWGHIYTGVSAIKKIGHPGYPI